MCWEIRADEYSCGHALRPGRDLPRNAKHFIRKCNPEHYPQCRGLHKHKLQESVPWMCPRCHWQLVQKSLGRLDFQADQAGPTIMEQGKKIPAERVSHTTVRTLEKTLQKSLQDVKQAVSKCGSELHKTRFQVLQEFFGADNVKSLGKLHILAEGKLDPFDAEGLLDQSPSPELPAYSGEPFARKHRRLHSGSPELPTYSEGPFARRHHHPRSESPDLPTYSDGPFASKHRRLH